ncbi:hypothetical protein PIB30_059955 [Stylosanthes scabra]|uniref:Uncharacterized protein n=1 Tax=Stylosanthes scabra TaxID=79078 RepID=A0ABU6RLJ1_9FABA|nr:hypothetical protein [Stylosanthes scabra]
MRKGYRQGCQERVFARKSVLKINSGTLTVEFVAGETTVFNLHLHDLHLKLAVPSPSSQSVDDNRGRSISDGSFSDGDGGIGEETAATRRCSDGGTSFFFRYVFRSLRYLSLFWFYGGGVIEDFKRGSAD